MFEHLWSSLFPQNKRKIICLISFISEQQSNWTSIYVFVNVGSSISGHELSIAYCGNSDSHSANIRVYAPFFFSDRNLSRSQSFYSERSYVPGKTRYWLCLCVARRILICLYIRSCGVVFSRSWSKYVRIVYKSQQAIIDYKQISSQSLEIFCLLLTKEKYLTYIKVFALFTIFRSTMSHQ